MNKYTAYAKKSGIEITPGSRIKNGYVVGRVVARFFVLDKEKEGFYFHMEPNEAHNLARNMRALQSLKTAPHVYKDDRKETTTVVTFQAYTSKTTGKPGYALLLNRSITGVQGEISVNVPLSESDVHFCADFLTKLALDSAYEVNPKSETAAVSAENTGETDKVESAAE